MRRRLVLPGWVGLAGLIAATALVLSGPWFFLGELVANLRFPLGLAGLAVVATLALARRPRPALVAALLAAVHVLPAARLEFGRPLSAASGQELRVACANLQFGRADPAALERLAEDFGPDILGLVEVLEPNRSGVDWSARFESWRDRWPHQEVVTYGRLFSMALLSRFPLEEVGQPDLHGGRPLPGLRRPILEATVVVGDQRLRVQLVHAERPGMPWRFPARVRLFDVLARGRGEEGDGDRPRLVMGDLNSSGTSPLFAGLLDRGDLADTRVGFGPCLSWSPPLLPGRWLALDHILVGGGLSVVERDTGSAIRSDHLPARAVLRMPGR